MPFQKGQSGNPNGKRRGTLNKSTIIARDLLEGEAEALVGKVIQLALEGDLCCLRICIERLVPPKKDASIELDLPVIESIADIQKLFSAITANIKSGGMTASAVKTLIDLAESMRKWLEVEELEKRISALEQNSK